MPISRRRFALLAGASAAAAQGGRVTAQQLTDRIRDNLGVPWQESSLDGFKAGDPSVEVTGIATTAMATMDVLSRAVKEKANLIVTAEPVFFARTETGVNPDDPVLQEKRAFLQKHGLAVFRLNDHWRARRPDPFAAGLAQAMSWTRHQSGDDVSRYEIPAVTIAALADDLAAKLKARAGIRVVGDPQTQVRRIALLPGVSALPAMIKLLPACDLVVAGETREWESVEYAQDTVSAGQKKGLILLGRVMSEDPGMNLCAEWLKKLVPEAATRWLPVGDPYWRPS